MIARSSEQYAEAQGKSYTQEKRRAQAKAAQERFSCPSAGKKVTHTPRACTDIRLGGKMRAESNGRDAPQETWR